MLRMLKLEIRHRTLRTEDSYHKHANNNKKQTLSWRSFVARVVHLTFLDDSDSKSPNEGRHRLKLIERVYSSATFDIMISATKSAPSKRSSRLQPICIRHLNTAPGTNFWILKQRTCNADHMTGQFPIKSSSRFIVVHLCFILQGCKNVPPDVLLPHMSLVMFRGFISSGTIDLGVFTRSLLGARKNLCCWEKRWLHLQRFCSMNWCVVCLWCFSVSGPATFHLLCTPQLKFSIRLLHKSHEVLGAGAHGMD